MPIFLKFDPETPLPPTTITVGEVKERIHITLKIERNERAGGKYTYSYSKNEFSLPPNVGSIEFELFDIESTRVHDIRIHGYVCTRPEALVPTYVGEGNKPLQTMNDGQLEWDPSQKVTFVRFEHRLQPFELVHIGLIVAIRETPNSPTEYILCDPQVGNGPPPTGTGLLQRVGPGGDGAVFGGSLLGRNQFLGFELT